MSIPRSVFAVCAALCIGVVVAGCTKKPTEPERPGTKNTPVEGRTSTKCNLSLEFPSGWVEVPPSGRPFTQYFDNKAEQLAIGLSSSTTAGQSVQALGDQVKRRLATGGEIIESGPTTVDGKPAFRIVASQTTATGKGIVIGLTIETTPGLQSTIFVFSANDERKNHRDEMEALLATLKVE